MYFFDGKLGAFERMMTQKPGYHRRSGKSGKDIPKKKPVTPKPAVAGDESKKGEKSDG